MQTRTQSIDLADFDFTGAHEISFSLGVLTLKNTAGQVVHLHFSGTYTLASFNLSGDGNFNGADQGTKIIDPPAPTKPQNPVNNLASLFSQLMASWTNPSAALRQRGALTACEVSCRRPSTCCTHMDD